MSLLLATPTLVTSFMVDNCARCVAILANSRYDHRLPRLTSTVT
jgi:hypothetical protein